MSLDLQALIHEIQQEMVIFHEARGEDDRRNTAREYMYLRGLDRETFTSLVAHFTTQQMARTLALMLEISAKSPLEGANALEEAEKLAHKLESNCEAVIMTAIIVAYRVGRELSNADTETG